MRTSNLSYFVAMAVIAFIFIGIGLLCQYTLVSANSETVTMLVTGRERIPTEDGSYYLVFTEEPGNPENTEVFKNEDIAVTFKFNSSDIQARMQEGKVCTFEVGGLRITFLSSYRNIISLEKCE